MKAMECNMENKYEFKGSKFPWKISPAILQIYSSPNNSHIDSGHEVCMVTRGDWGDKYPVIKPINGFHGCEYRAEIEMDIYGNTPEEIAQANARMIQHVDKLFNACVNFVNKVDAGRARSTNSYNEMKNAIELALGLKEDKSYE